MTKDFESISSLIAHFPTGSRVICNPPVMNTDEDYVLLVTHLTQAKEQLERKGYTMTTDESYKKAPKLMDFMSDFRTFRKGEENLIVVNHSDAYLKWKLATQLATRFNLQNKQDRIDLFKAIRFGAID